MGTEMHKSPDIASAEMAEFTSAEAFAIEIASTPPRAMAPFRIASQSAHAVIL